MKTLKQSDLGLALFAKICLQCLKYLWRPLTHPYAEAWWPSGRASDSGARGRGFDPHSGRCVMSFSKIYLPPKKDW